MIIISEKQFLLINFNKISTSQLQRHLSQGGFFQESCESSEGEWYSTFYTINQWPHVCVIDPRTGGRLVTFSNFKIDSFVEAGERFYEKIFELVFYVGGNGFTRPVSGNGSAS